eukprot:CAMPEP_0181453102 /NCGR_PEP_ID=MMETSP1110-20121109/29553_1 /TAXON_ID=174948 /ORGANISM="Symbiodinium sp., Strain CCMP421" /LENGTH=49 /DNA_ID= /DNA_START= /DNA_END= /DNA_ORIENTATION=
MTSPAELKDLLAVPRPEFVDGMLGREFSNVVRPLMGRPPRGIQVEVSTQ